MYRALVNAQQGFSLVEVLVALAVLGILTPAIVGIFVGGVPVFSMPAAAGPQP